MSRTATESQGHSKSITLALCALASLVPLFPSALLFSKTLLSLSWPHMLKRRGCREISYPFIFDLTDAKIFRLISHYPVLPLRFCGEDPPVVFSALSTFHYKVMDWPSTGHLLASVSWCPVFPARFCCLKHFNDSVGLQLSELWHYQLPAPQVLNTPSHGTFAH